MYLNIKAFSLKSYLDFYKAIGGTKKYENNKNIIFDNLVFDNVKITFYKNLSILFNGFISDKLNNMIDLIIDKNIYVGIDEVGVGESIGPLIVCALRFNNYQDKKKVILNGIKDSKKMNAEEVREKSEFIKKHSKHYCVTMEPQKFNETYKKVPNTKKINAILQNELNKKFEQEKLIHITDQFVNENKYNEYIQNSESSKFNGRIIFEQKAEEKYLEVAGAAIIAKSKFNNWVLESLKEDGIEFKVKNKLDSWGLFLKIKNDEIKVKDKNKYIKKWEK